MTAARSTARGGTSIGKVFQGIVRRSVTMCVAGACVCAPAIALADPVRIVTTGQIYQLVEDGETGARLVGSGFIIPDAEVRRDGEGCFPCLPGSALDLSATIFFRAFPPGFPTVDGRSYESVQYGGSLEVDAGSVIVPALAVGESARRSTSFTFTGTLMGFADESRTGAPLFALRLFGGGTASMGFFRWEASPDTISADGFSYEFDELAATPEPGSLLLFATGAGWFARRWRSRRA